MVVAKRTRDAIIVLGAVAAAAALVLPFAMRQAPAIKASAPPAIAESGGRPVPTADQMCAARGVTGADLEQCRSDEASAEEYVAAWMGLYGFLGAGGIDTDQIQLQASLGDNDPLSPHPELDPTGIPGLDVSADQFQSPAQVAIYCLARLDDWMQLHDCLAENDPDQGQGENGLGLGASAEGIA